ncbi:hypothetical protein [Hyphomicrobium sp.]|uniref:hypothetical protein n=1 Tax=Hyphomicrobium sp. TaxID=82 RepID=UPI003F6FDF0F
MKWYVASVVIAGILTFLLLFPGVAFLGLMALVLPVLFLPTIFTYLVAIGPGLLAYDLTRNLKWALPISATCVAAVAYGLPEFARFSFDRVVSSYQRDDAGVLPVKI